MTGQQQTEYDAIVIGSGITGGWAAKELTEKGLRTLMIERGREVVHGKDYPTEHKSTWEMPLRDARLSPDKRGAEDYQKQARTGQFRESTKHFFAKDTKHPYEETKPFTWVQGDQVGGHLVTDEDRRDDDGGHPADPGQPQGAVPLARRPQDLAEARVN